MHHYPLSEADLVFLYKLLGHYSGGPDHTHLSEVWGKLDRYFRGKISCGQHSDIGVAFIVGMGLGCWPLLIADDNPIDTKYFSGSARIIYSNYTHHSITSGDTA